MKKFILLLVLIGITLPATAKQETFNGNPVSSVQEGKPVRIYNQYGSHISTLKKKSNGEVREYNSTGSYVGKYRERAGKVIHYQKN